MKNLILILLFGLSTSCMAQKKISDIKSNSTVSASLYKYKVIKDKGTVVENQGNKFNGIKQHTPNLPININIYPYYVKKDIPLMLKICALNMDLGKLEKLTAKPHNGLLITLKCDQEGNIIDVSFYTREEDSMLTIAELEGVEKMLRASKVVKINPELKKFLAGSNFLTVDTGISFSEIPKIKKAN